MPAFESAPAADWTGAAADAAAPTLEELRVALRPPELPLPAPRTALEAAECIHDLLNADRTGDAQRLALGFSASASSPVDELALARARLRCARVTGRGDAYDLAASDMVRIMRRAGYREQALATGIVLSQQGPAASRTREAAGAMLAGAGASGATASVGSTARAGGATPRDAGRAAARRRHRGADDAVSPQMMTLVRGIAAAATGASVDPRREAAILRAALDVLPDVSDRVLGCPRTLLGLRLAQMLEGAGDPHGAMSAALDVLDAAADAVHDDAMDEGHDAAVALDPERAATSAHAVLARVLREAEPVAAARHAVDALEALHWVDDPPLRIGLITDLLLALISADLPERASFTAGRLLSLQRTLPRDEQRIAPLLAVAAQRVGAGRFDAALVPLNQARAIARARRDRRAGMEAARLAAIMHDRAGDMRASVAELRRLAADASWLADDLATAQAERGVFVRAELDAQALVMRRCLDLGDVAGAETAARAIVRRTSEAGRPVLPVQLLWDHRVDAYVGLFLAAGLARGGNTAGPEPGGNAAGRAQGGNSAARETNAQATNSRDTYERRRRDVLVAIGEMPPGHDARARYWAAYLEDRHAAMLAESGQRAAALKVARRARAAWASLEQDTADDLARVDALIAELEHPTD